MRTLIVQLVDINDIRHLPPPLQDALPFLHENYRERLKVSDIAQATYVCESHLSHLFSEHIDASPLTYQAALRIKEACRLIRQNPHIRITQLAKDVGYEGLWHFERAFKLHQGCTPSQFRRKTLAALPRKQHRR